MREVAGSRTWAVCASLIMALAATTVYAEDTCQIALQTKEQALERALAYSGFLEAPGFVVPNADSCVKMMPIIDSTTPFLSDSVSGDERWVVTFDSVFLKVGKWSDEAVRNQIRKSYHFVLDPVTGRLLKVYSEHGRFALELTPEPTAEEAARELSRNERYVSFVDTVPPVSLYGALGRAFVAQPLSSKEIHGWLVMHSSHGLAPRPCWVILARGTPRGPSHSVSLPRNMDRHLPITTSIRCAAWLTRFPARGAIVSDPFLQVESSMIWT